MDEKYYGRVDLTTEVLVKAGRLVAQLEVMTDLEDKILFLAAELHDHGEAVKGRALAEVGVEPAVDGFVTGMRATMQQHGEVPCSECGCYHSPAGPCAATIPQCGRCGEQHEPGERCDASGIAF